ncbi:hypothetical protein DAI22_12g196500 [Oryza sativa Japonica Group]|nr:hypothetical protein DAI22_12g196500 [Oryza sativa Japonica Group]
MAPRRHCAPPLNLGSTRGWCDVSSMWLVSNAHVHHHSEMTTPDASYANKS